MLRYLIHNINTVLQNKCGFVVVFRQVSEMIQLMLFNEIKRNV